MSLLLSTSKGNQQKALNDGYWYKIDNLYESAMEVIASQYLNLFDFGLPLKIVQYFPVIDEKTGICGCMSKDFLSKGCRVKTAYRLLLSEHNKSYYKQFDGKPEQEYKVLVETLSKYNSMFGIYLTELLMIDCLIRNRDRHTNNIALICNETGVYDFAPVFDNGDSLFQNEIPFKSAYECLKTSNVAKTFNISYYDQLKIATYYYPAQVRLRSNLLDLSNNNFDMYPEYVINRALETLKYTTRQYMNEDLIIKL